MLSVKLVLTSGLLSITGAGLYSLNSINLPVYYSSSKFQRQPLSGKVGTLVPPIQISREDRINIGAKLRGQNLLGSMNHARYLRNQLMREYFVDLSFQTIDTRKVRSLTEIKRKSDLTRYELCSMIMTELEASGTKARLLRLIGSDIPVDFWLSNREIIEVFDENTDRWLMYDPFFDVFVSRKKKVLSSAEFMEAVRASDKSLEVNSSKFLDAKEYLSNFNVRGLILQVQLDIGKREKTLFVLTDDDQLMLTGSSITYKFYFTNNISQFDSIGI